MIVFPTKTLAKEMLEVGKPINWEMDGIIKEEVRLLLIAPLVSHCFVGLGDVAIWLPMMSLLSGVLIIMDCKGILIWGVPQEGFNCP